MRAPHRSQLILAVSALLCLAACSDDGLAWADTIATLDTAVEDDTTEDVDAPVAEASPVDAAVDAAVDTSIECTVPDVPTDNGPKPPPDWWGEDIQAQAEQWQWIDFPETFCADGSPTGLGVNLSPGATRALIYFEGGGACWDYSTCTGLVETSFHLGGFGADDFDSLLIEVYKNMLLFDRGEPKNPFADAHFVFLPYCTGDVFSGDKVTELQGLLPFNKATLHFKGAHNVAEYLKRLAPTFKDVDEVVLAGSSAGGFGAGFSWHRAREAFAPIPVHLIDDSGPPIQPAGNRWEMWKEAWGMQFPAECPKCSDGLGEVVKFFQETMLKDAKLGLITYANDAIISTFLGLAPWDFEAGLNEIYAIFDTVPNAQYFVVPGILHTMLIGQNEAIEGPGGTPLWWWISNMFDNQPAWKSVKP